MPDPASGPGRLRHLEFGAIALQFALIVLVVTTLNLESRSFAHVLTLAFGGFFVQHFLPAGWRLWFFAGLSIVATLMILGVGPGLATLAIGLVLIGICHLPGPFFIRCLLLVAVGTGLAYARAHAEWFPQLRSMWPILGSMFIFRLMIYLYDLKHRVVPAAGQGNLAGATPFSVERALAYFFMLPNVCFPLFPIVDYKTFCTSDCQTDRIPVYQRGLSWMLRGIVHLLLYRLVYQLGAMDTVDIQTGIDVARFMLCTYLLYLRVSGQFHLIVGLLLMFGFDLPETHHLYLLASSFTDFWRRINIYWKDFIMKVFFNPVYFQIRGIGPIKALALATIVSFFATWILHSWQWFWFRGSFLVTWPDIFFWTVLAVLVLIGAVREATAGRKRTLTKSSMTAKDRLVLGLKTVGTFVCICTLWTIWSCKSGGELLVLAEVAMRTTPGEALLILGGLTLIGVAGAHWGTAHRNSTNKLAGLRREAERPPIWRPALAVSTGAIAILVIPQLLEAYAAPPIAKFAGVIRERRLSYRDAASRRRGYYEDLDAARLAGDDTWEASEPPPGWHDGSDEIYRNRENDFQHRDLHPSKSLVFYRARTTTNRWGMRDREYEKAKPAGAYRIALVGSSHEMGTGVDDSETFEHLVEEQLNADPPDSRCSVYQILNFSTGGMQIYQKLMKLDEMGYDFEPDAVIYMVNSPDLDFVTTHICKAINSRIEIPYPELVDLLNKIGVNDWRLKAPVIQNRLHPHRFDLLSMAFRRLASECARRSIRAMVAYRPGTLDDDAMELSVSREIERRARETGLDYVDLTHAFSGVANRRSLILAPWDDHCNAEAHRLIAMQLYPELVKRLRPSGEGASPRPSSAE